jgi:hypothetical protein
MFDGWLRDLKAIGAQTSCAKAWYIRIGLPVTVPFFFAESKLDAGEAGYLLPTI